MALQAPKKAYQFHDAIFKNQQQFVAEGEKFLEANAKKLGVNMTKLESYQNGASFAATEFFADIEGAPGDPAVDRALDELAFHCNKVRLLGTYKQERKRG